VCVI